MRWVLFSLPHFLDAETGMGQLSPSRSGIQTWSPGALSCLPLIFAAPPSLISTVFLTVKFVVTHFTDEEIDAKRITDAWGRKFWCL